MGEVTPFTGGKVPAVFQGNTDVNDDLSAGVRGGYSVVSIRQAKWHIKADGEETTLMSADGNPLGSLKLVLLKGSPNVSKNFYADGFVEGSSEPPTCSSIDGITPDPGGADVQAPSCAVCPQNVIGSRVTEAGKKLKACADSRRIAVIPENDFKNEVFGGPMLLRVPAGSLTNLSMYGKKMKKVGFPYNTLVTRCSFDTTTAYPKLEFNAVRPLTDPEAEEIVQLLSDPEFSSKIEAVLAKDMEIVLPIEGELETQRDLFEQPPDTPEEKPKPAAKAKPAVKAATKAVAKPAEKEEAIVVADDSDDELDSELKDILGSLENLD